MIADLTTWSLAFHAPVCGFAWLATFKLGGESKFATDQVKDLEGLRPKLLRAISRSLAEKILPSLILADSVNVPRLIVPGEGDVRTTPNFTPIGDERLRDSVRDFVKADISQVRDLRILEHTETCLRAQLKRLRIGTWILAVMCGVFTLAAVLAKTEAFDACTPWPHFVAFGLVILVFVFLAYFALRIQLANNRGDDLKKAYGDLS